MLKYAKLILKNHIIMAQLTQIFINVYPNFKKNFKKEKI